MLALALAMMASVPDAAMIGDTGLITVTATRIEALADSAGECARGACPPRKDIAVTVAYASALFDDGRYLDAKKLLAGAVARTAGLVRAEPLAVSQLYHAQATLSAHEGDQATTRTATWASANILAAALPVASLPRLTAEVRLADWQLRTGDARGAVTRYTRIGQLAAGAGHSALADGMTLRQAQALHWLGRDAEARRLLATLAERAGSGSQEARGAAIATLARMSFAKGNDSIGIAALRRLGAAGPASHPMLVWEATLPRPAVRDVPEGELWSRDRGPRGADVTGLRWVDIGYVIKPDGSVADVHTRRGSDRLGWAQPLIGYIGARRYLAFVGEPVSRVERFTLTADYGVPIGSLVRRRVRDPRFEMMPMTVPEQVAAAN